MISSWIYQGRQYHGWFGHGKGPGKHPPDPSPAVGILAQRIHAMGHTLVAGLPHAKRNHSVGRLSQEDHARLDRVLTAVVQALPLGLSTLSHRVFGTEAGAPGIGDIARAATLLRDGRDNADLRAATDALGQAALAIGLDHFKGFLRRADEHIAGQGGLLTLVRDVPSAVPPPPEAPVRVPPPLLPARPWGPPLIAAAAIALPALAKLIERQEFQDTIKRFDLDASKPADITAAYAYVWAEHLGPWIFDTDQTGPKMLAMAERVMRAARADPNLFSRALNGNADAQKAFAAAVQAPAPGSGIETHDAEERALVAVLQSQGRSSAEIQNALDDLRAQRAAPTTKQRRIMRGVSVMTEPQPPPLGPDWLNDALKQENGSAIPGQVAAQLNGRHFLTFNDLRRAIWDIVGRTPELTQNFTNQNRGLARNGNAPYPPDSEKIRDRLTGEVIESPWQLHHDPSIQSGASVYNLSNLRVVTPRQHDELTRKERQK